MAKSPCDIPWWIITGQVVDWNRVYKLYLYKYKLSSYVLDLCKLYVCYFLLWLKAILFFCSVILPLLHLSSNFVFTAVGFMQTEAGLEQFKVSYMRLRKWKNHLQFPFIFYISLNLRQRLPCGNDFITLYVGNIMLLKYIWQCHSNNLVRNSTYPNTGNCHSKMFLP